MEVPGQCLSSAQPGEWTRLPLPHGHCVCRTLEVSRADGARSTWSARLSMQRGPAAPPGCVCSPRASEDWPSSPEAQHTRARRASSARGRQPRTWPRRQAAGAVGPVVSWRLGPVFSISETGERTCSVGVERTIQTFSLFLSKNSFSTLFSNVYFMIISKLESI